MSCGLGVCLALVMKAELALAGKFAGRALTALTASILDPVPDTDKAIVVLMSDQTDSASLAATWPLEAGAYQDWIAKVWCLGAEAVYVDVTFGSGTFVKSGAESVRELADTAWLLSNAAESAPEFAAFREANCSPKLRQSRLRNRMPVFFAAPSDSRISQLFGGEIRGQGAKSLSVSARFDGNVVLSGAPAGEYVAAAVALAAAFCDRLEPGDRRQCKRRTGRTSRLEIADRIHGVDYEAGAVNVGIQQPDTPGFAGGFPGCLESGNLAARLLRVSWSPLQDWQTCPPVATLSWHEFSLPAPEMEKLRSKISGKILILGATSPEIGADFVETPLHRGLPGVYLHALAANQLLSRSYGSTSVDWLPHLLVLIAAFGLPVLLIKVSQTLADNTDWFLGVMFHLSIFGRAIFPAAGILQGRDSADAYFISGFSREQELEADASALEATVAAKRDVGGLHAVLRRFGTSAAMSSPSSSFSGPSHPDSERRRQIVNIRMKLRHPLYEELSSNNDLMPLQAEISRYEACLVKFYAAYRMLGFPFSLLAVDTLIKDKGAVDLAEQQARRCATESSQQAQRAARRLSIEDFEPQLRQVWFVRLVVAEIGARRGQPRSTFSESLETLMASPDVPESFLIQSAVLATYFRDFDRAETLRKQMDSRYGEDVNLYPLDVAISTYRAMERRRRREFVGPTFHTFKCGLVISKNMVGPCNEAEANPRKTLDRYWQTFSGLPVPAIN